MNTQPIIPNIPTLADLSARLDCAESRVCAAENRYVRAEKRFRVLCAGLFGAITVAVSLPFVSPAVAQGYGMTLAQAATRISALETKTASMSAITDPNTGKATVRFSGVNVQIVSGQGTTDEGALNDATTALSGLGNLIIGYNEGGNGRGDNRDGSHNLVLGTQSSYRAFSGFVMGQNNTIGGRDTDTNALQGFYATVSGGQANLCTGNLANISGGYSNTASGVQASVSGGYSNTANGNYSSVSGGRNNTASNDYSNVSGGRNNTASGFYSSVSGGQNNMASGLYSSASGGTSNTASGSYASISGGISNTASGYASNVSGGYYVQQTNTYGFSAGGQFTSASPGEGIFHSP